MKTQRNIFIAFILNLSFSIFEFIGGMITGSVAILSDAVHDMGDAASIGVSYFLERKSRKHPDKKYTYGYARYSVIGGFMTTLILLVGSAVMIYRAFTRMITPAEINYNGMIVFAVVGVCVNFCAAFFTRQGGSFNQKAVNLHMLEDVLGWAVVLLGAIIMRFTDFTVIDPIMSMAVSAFILINAVKHMKGIFDLFLEKAPPNIDVDAIREHCKKIDGILDVHHIHLWSLDGQNNYATMHVVTDSVPYDVKKRIKEELRSHGIVHVTIEVETGSEQCCERDCCAGGGLHSAHAHHHGH